jgi:hypothetical protein
VLELFPLFQVPEFAAKLNCVLTAPAAIGNMRANFAEALVVQFRRGIAQSGSAPALGAGCREFESLYPDHYLDIQVGERSSARSSAG